MKRIEVDVDLGLSGDQEARIELHSFHNVLNIIFGELQILQRVLGDETALAESLGVCEAILSSFDNRQRALESVERIEEHKRIILRDVDQALRLHSTPEEHRHLVQESLENLRSILGVVDVRVRELLARQNVAGRWEAVPTSEIEEGQKQVFTAIARNARGRYGIVFEPEEQGENDYLIEVEIRGDLRGAIRIPPVLTDVMRDLTANARKYTDPGGCVESRLSSDGQAVELTVRDTGRGIPPDELDQVVRFGIRASNTRPSETKGAGFGLTKAYYVCRQHGGRMWLQSGLGEGTAVTLHLPRPA